ncbi:CubicO group peptidase, beta-lactamase class C family [Rhizobiales bacterium GAS113]|nr:CubicO group peptidase, beta-lactamase class C family [Rhizobiales bacterium GAS113]
MDRWLKAALDYIPRWLDFQMRISEQPGSVVAIAHQGRIVLEEAFGHADLATGEALTPRHRLRVASHSKAFTAAAVMRLVEQGKLRLDDRAGEHVEGLHPAIAKASLAQLLSHSAGLTRDGDDTGQWADRRPFLDEDELRAALREPPVIDANTRFKYSNHGYGLAGLIIEAVSGEPYQAYVARAIVRPAGLDETTPDMPLPQGAILARGHSGKLPLGRRVVIPGENPTHALASATGFVSTARDLARFFGQLAPNAKKSVLTVESRREMIRKQWRDPQLALERHYGLGLMSGKLGDWDWFGHSGGFQGFITRTLVLPELELAISVLTNAADGLSHGWLDGIVHILHSFSKKGAPDRKLASWGGRWWALWGAADLVPMGDKVMVAAPALLTPFLDASEITVTGKDRGKITGAIGGGSFGQSVRRVRNKEGEVAELWLAGGKALPEADAARELRERYESSAQGGTVRRLRVATRR